MLYVVIFQITMYKQSPSRSHRSKGIKVKHILQICLLLAVCFWLFYQVKHSHEKRKEFDTKDGKVVGKVQIDGEIQRFGRKDLPRATEIAANVEKQVEDEEEKDVEEEEEEEENKHEEVEPVKEDNKHEVVDGGRGGGDDEIDDNETERIDAEPEHEEESVDEDKEREENQGGSEENHTITEENEDAVKDHSENEQNEGAGKEEHTEVEESEDVRREDHNESDAASEDQDHDGVNANTHEAREEQYKADDASSEVAHEIQTIIPETGNLTTGQASEIWGKVSFGQGNETRTADKDDALIQAGVQPREDTDQNVTSTTTITEQKKYEIDSNKSEDSPLQNSTLPGNQNDQPQNRSSSTDIGGERAASLLSDGTQMELPSSLSENATGEGAMLGEELTGKSKLAKVSSSRTENMNRDAQDAAMHGEEHTSQSELADVSSNRNENVNSNAEETLDPSHGTSGTDMMKTAEDSSSKPGEKSSDSGTSESDVSSESRSSDESAGSIQHGLIDTARSSRAQEESESKMDSSSLPDIGSEIQNTHDKVAE